MGKLVLVACTNVGRYIIEELMQNKELKTDLVGVINLNTEQASNKANYDSYADLAWKYQIEIKYCNNVNDPEICFWLKEKKPDVILQSGWSQKFGDELLSIPRFGCIGEHPAPLPKGRGAACINWAILTGETKWGDSFFEMVQEYDKGRIYAQKEFDIIPADTVYTVYEKVATTSVQIVRENIDDWTNGIFQIKSQDELQATYYKRRRPSDGEIKSFDEQAMTLHNFIRAQTTPYPGAYIVYKGEKIKILSSACSEEETALSYGSIVTIKEDGAVSVACRNGEVLDIIRVQKEGQPSMWAKDWVIQNHVTHLN